MTYLYQLFSWNFNYANNFLGSNCTMNLLFIASDFYEYSALRYAQSGVVGLEKSLMKKYVDI